MIKVETIQQSDSVDLVFESREKDEASLKQLDLVYDTLMGIRTPDITTGGYLNTGTFKVNVKLPKA